MNRIEVSNFRKIRDNWNIDIAPITFFTGTNNSGKSTILKSLLLIEDHNNSNNHFELSFDGENAKKHKIDCYDNAVNRLNKSESYKDLSIQYENRGYTIRYSFQPSEDKSLGKGRLIRLEVERSDGAKLVVYSIGGQNYQMEFDDALLERSIDSRESDQNNYRLIESISKILNDNEEELKNLTKIIQQNETYLAELKLMNREQLALFDINKIDDGKFNLRLNKVLREFNISLDKAVEFLSSNGVEIEARPTTKINKEIYLILASEFSKNSGTKPFENSKRIKSIILEHRIKSDKKNEISLKQEILDSKRKLNIAKKRLDSQNNSNKPKTIYRPEFSLEDFHPSDRTVDRVIRRVLPSYIKDHDNSTRLAGLGNAIPRVFRLAERINLALFFTVDYLSPHRNNQTRLYINNNTSTNINELIKEHSSNPILKSSKAGIFLKKWMNEFDIGDDYRIKSIDGVASKIEIFEEKFWTNLVDKGFGAGQIFSILLKIALCVNSTNKELKLRSIYKRERLIVIEEPEANLHPALQSKLTELFLDSYTKFRIKFLVETHSEYILRKSQILVKELGLDEDALKGLPFLVYYFDKLKGPYKMNYRSDGIFKDDFGTGFFDVASKHSIELLKRKRHNG